MSPSGSSHAVLLSESTLDSNSKFSSGIRQIRWEGPRGSGFAFLQCHQPLAAAAGWAWPYLPPHPRIMRLVCVASASSAVVFDAGEAEAPVGDVLAWLRLSEECGALDSGGRQRLCFTLALQARPPCSLHDLNFR